MTPEELDQIEQWWGSTRGRVSGEDVYRRAHEDIPKLVAEVKRLRDLLEESERLHKLAGAEDVENAEAMEQMLARITELEAEKQRLLQVVDDSIEYVAPGWGGDARLRSFELVALCQRLYKSERELEDKLAASEAMESTGRTGAE